MEPPKMTPARRRVSSTQETLAAPPPSVSSPTLPTLVPKSMHNSATTRRPSSSRQIVSVDWEEADNTVSRSTSRLQIELAECVETKTVTTTTTTKRSYPPLLFHQTSLEKLDSKEYPLASKPLPAYLANFSYELDRPSKIEPRIERKSRQVKIEKPYLEDSEDDIKTRPLTKPQAPEKADRHRVESLTQRLAHINQRRAHSRSNSPQFTSRSSRSTKEKSPEGFLPHRRGLGLHLTNNTPFPATPTSEAEASAHDRSHLYTESSFFEDLYTPQSGQRQNSVFEDTTSPSDSSNQEFANAVATPPVAESDLEPVEESDAALANPTSNLPVLNTVAAQNASLPSPGLSPTFAAVELSDEMFPSGDGTGYDASEGASPTTQEGDSQLTLLSDLPRSFSPSHGISNSTATALSQPSSILSTTAMIESFDAMPNDMQTFMMYHFLRRCSRKTLHVVADVVNPALKCDFLEQLPYELGLQILGFLDFKDLSRCSQVSKQWRNIVDGNEAGWKDLIDRDGFVLPVGELQRAISQGWGWQDPYGPDGCERDLGPPQPKTPEDSSALIEEARAFTGTSRKLRASTKRKRASVIVNSDRNKRRATHHEFASTARSLVVQYPRPPKPQREGPLTAAAAAEIAVPDPGVGLPGLRKLHLFKSLYRRHYMLQRNWMSGDVAPHHFAFPAHPNNVITCLQFDDDKILTGSDDTFIHVYDTKTGKLRKKLEGHEGGVWALQYEGNVLVSGSTDRSVRVWDIEKGLCTQVFHGHTSTVRCLQILMPDIVGYDEQGQAKMVPEKPLIITGSRDSQLRVWKLPEPGSTRYIQTGPPANDTDCPYFVRVLAGHTHSVRAIAAHQDTLVSGSYDNTVRVWKISTGETVHRLQGHAMKVYSVVLDHKRNRCISGSMDNFVKIWSLETGACLYTLEGHSSLVGLLDLRDERLVSAAADSTLRIWDPENGQCKNTLTAHTGAITCFQHDGQKVISGSDRTLKMWNVKTGECMKDLLTDLTGVWQVKFDERRCIAAVQRDNLTYIEVLDFGASRDGIPANQRGPRKLLRVDDGRSAYSEDEDTIVIDS